MHKPTHTSTRLLFAASLVALTAAGCTAAIHRGAASPRHPREPLVGPVHPRAVVSAHGMVVASSPEAARVGARVLEEGGTAMDAAVATIFALMPTDPFSVGPASELVLMLHTADGREVVLDAPSFAPLRVDPEVLRKLKREKKLADRRSSTVPTILAVLGTAQERFCTWSLPRLMAPAIEIAREGFVLSFYQRMILREYHDRIAASPVSSSMLHFRPNGDIPPVLTRIQYPGLIATLERLSEAGWRDFYEGRLAAAMASDMSSHGGWVARNDLARVPRCVRESEPLSMEYRGHRIVVPGRPWGGPALLEALQILGQFPDWLVDADSVDHVHLMIEAARLAQYDQMRETRRSSLPAGAFRGATLPSGARALARLIDLTRMVQVGASLETAAVPSGDRNTTQLDVFDTHGNAVSATMTLGRYLGCHVGSPDLGFFYNSLLEGFQYEDPMLPQYPRPLATVQSYMTPTMVLENSRPTLLLGTGGSGRITSFVLEVLSNVLDRGMDLQRAVAHPRVGWSGPGEKGVDLELAPPLVRGVEIELKRRGFENINAVTYPATIYAQAHLGGVDCAAFDPGTGLYTGVADPRREGFAVAPERPTAGSDEVAVP